MRKIYPPFPETVRAKPLKHASVLVILFIVTLFLATILPGKSFAQAPAIASFNPAGGPVGTLVTINGTSLGTPTAFTIGGKSAIVVSNTGSVLMAMVMPGAVTGAVSITTAGGTAGGNTNFVVTATPFPSIQEGPKLSNTTSYTTGNQGYSVSMSADGNTAIVGGPADNSNQGGAWVYTRSGSSWTQQGPELVGTGSLGAKVEQGFSVSLSADGNTAIVGGAADNSNEGAAWVYTRTGDTWTQQGSKLVGTGSIGTANQGFSVCLSADGNTAIVGGNIDNSQIGAAWVYTRSGGVWTQQGTKLVGTGSVGAANQGYSVSISADGNTAIVGGPIDNSAIGAAWVFTRSGGGWSQQGSKLTGTGSVGAAQQGISVSLSADGSTAMVGGSEDNSQLGAVWVYIRSAGAWAQQGPKLVGTGSVGSPVNEGNSVSLSADGNTAIVGGTQDDSQMGATWVYTRSGNSWTQQGSKLVASGSDLFVPPNQGYSVSLSANGNTALIGAPGDNQTIGAAWLFTGPPTIAAFNPAAGPPGTLITINGTGLSDATSVTIGGQSAIVVFNTSNTVIAMVMPGTPKGMVLINTPIGTSTSTGSFTPTATPYPSAQKGSKRVGAGSTGAAQQGHAIGISADGNTAIVGGYADNSSQGAAWVYTRSGGGWLQQGSMLVGTGSVGAAQQGWSVALSADGNTAIVGGNQDNSGVGAVWIFIRSDGVWTQQGPKLVGTGGIGTQAQGYAVALSADGNTAIVGGNQDNSGFGATWVYIRSGEVWTQQGLKLVGAGGAGTPNQGVSVSLSADGNTAVVGGNLDNSFQGAAWVYIRSGGTWAQQGFKLVGTGNTGIAEQGASVSLSADGNTAIVGGSDDNSGVGAAWVYTSSGGIWTQQGSKLVGTGSVGPAAQGCSVSLSADGNTAIIGGYADNSNQGAAWVYTRSGSTWAQQGSKLVGRSALGPAAQGYSISLSADGTTAIAGAPFDNSSLGAIWFYTVAQSTITSFSPAVGPPGTLITINGTNLGAPTALTIGGQGAIVISNTGSAIVAMVMPGALTGTVSITTGGGTASGSANFTVTATKYPSIQQGSKLVGTGNVGTAQRGYSVAVSADGNTAIVGGDLDNSSHGAAWIYTRSGGTWTQQGSKLVGTGSVGAALQGSAVALSADGNTAIVGGYQDNLGQGAIWIFTRSGSAWTQGGPKHLGTGSVGAAEQGWSVSLSADGNTAIVGGFADNTNQGAAWVYTRNNGVWTQQGSKLVGTGNTGAAEQGWSVSLSADGNTAIVGGASDNSGIGAAWVYTRNNGAWAQQGLKLAGSGSVGPSQQGNSVSISANGNTAVVGGPADNSFAGAAWVYTRSGSAWVQQGAKLVGTGSAGAAEQGYSVSLSADGSSIIVGGAADNSSIGAAWVYNGSGSSWAQKGTKLVGTGGVGTQNQAFSVSLSADGSTAIAGGIADNSNQGAAWAFIAAVSNNALLSTIKLTPASTLTNTGTTGTKTTYTTTAAGTTASVTVTPTAQDANATIKVNGVAVISGTASASIALPVGQTTINMVVTAQDGTTTRTYSIIVTKATSNNALLSTIKLTPASSLTNTGTTGTTTTYTTTAASATTSVTVTPTAQDATATIKVNGIAVTSGTASGSIALPFGQTTITTVVTAQDGTTTHTYSITVTRLSNNALLSVLKLTPASALTNTGTIGTTTTYTTSVSNATTSVTVTPTAQDANAKIKVNSVAVTSGAASGSIALAVGTNTITTVVTAQDGITTHTYTITVSRATGPLMSLYMPVSVVQPADNFSLENDGVMVHQGVSPNGDGINDFLTIDGIIGYPINSLQIIDRNGTLIYQAKGYNNVSNVFDGHSGINGRMLQPGTYFYSLNYVANGQARHKTGFIILRY